MACIDGAQVAVALLVVASACTERLPPGGLAASEPRELDPSVIAQLRERALAGVREHADEIATRSQGPGYTALMLRTEMPPDEAAAALPRPRSLFCSCCGGWTTGRQWHNRDRGYGVCLSCVEWMEKRGTDADEIRRNYGTRGVHFDIAT